LVNHHDTLRQMLGHKDWTDKTRCFVVHWKSGKISWTQSILMWPQA
jgi:hypothetical protein